MLNSHLDHATDNYQFMFNYLVKSLFLVETPNISKKKKELNPTVALFFFIPSLQEYTVNTEVFFKLLFKFNVWEE